MCIRDRPDNLPDSFHLKGNSSEYGSKSSQQAGNDTTSEQTYQFQDNTLQLYPTEQHQKQQQQQQQEEQKQYQQQEYGQYQLQKQTNLKHKNENQKFKETKKYQLLIILKNYQSKQQIFDDALEFINDQ
eukprot:TRINITY_DN1340_c0_g1_i2.p5 TRINITY_DN1340_c0_g1~~TRINITY_DN1340_c0_g1_i2.p5  ORF type:complete len:129 (-),score=32.19 TRINITY_DN1340_c0_g1_i2:590-976(-)